VIKRVTRCKGNKRLLGPQTFVREWFVVIDWSSIKFGYVLKKQNLYILISFMSLHLQIIL